MAIRADQFAFSNLGQYLIPIAGCHLTDLEQLVLQVVPIHANRIVDHSTVCTRLAALQRLKALSSLSVPLPMVQGTFPAFSNGHLIPTLLCWYRAWDSHPLVLLMRQMR